MSGIFFYRLRSGSRSFFTELPLPGPPWIIVFFYRLRSGYLTMAIGFLFFFMTYPYYCTPKQILFFSGLPLQGPPWISLNVFLTKL